MPTVEKNQDLSKTPAYKLLKVGDPWTFYLRVFPKVDGEPIKVGDTICKWFNTAEPGRCFVVTRIHEDKLIFETKYTGFQEP